MKTYFFDTINRFKRFSQKLDVATTLCNKTWIVFNDSGERELYIFQPDGSVFITYNGIGIIGHWQWIATNKSLVIHSNGGAIMLHPQYIDDVILALNLDGTNETAFLIEEKNHESFAPKTLTQLHNYFFNKEQKLIASQQEAEKERRRLIAEQERRRWEEEKEKQLESQAVNMLFDWQMEIRKSSSTIYYKWFAVSLIITIIFVLINPFNFQSQQGSSATIIGLSVMWFFPCFIICFIAAWIHFSSDKQNRHKKLLEKINNWKKANPNNPINKYLTPETVRIQGF